MAANTRPPAASIADFNIFRQEDPPRQDTAACLMSHLEPWLGRIKIPDWRFFTLNRMVSLNNLEEISGELVGYDSEDYDFEDSENEDDDDEDAQMREAPRPVDRNALTRRVFLLDYNTYLATQTYQVLNAQLRNEPPENALPGTQGTRRTDMRLHEMIRDTWATEVREADAALLDFGDDDDDYDEEARQPLQNLAFRMIENAQARQAIANEFEAAISQGSIVPTALRITVDGPGEGRTESPYWRDNPFNGTAVNVAGDASKLRAHLMRVEPGLAPENAMHMFVEINVRR